MEGSGMPVSKDTSATLCSEHTLLFRIPKLMWAVIPSKTTTKTERGLGRLIMTLAGFMHLFCGSTTVYFILQQNETFAAKTPTHKVSGGLQFFYKAYIHRCSRKTHILVNIKFTTSSATQPHWLLYHPSKYTTAQQQTTTNNSTGSLQHEKAHKSQHQGGVQENTHKVVRGIGCDAFVKADHFQRHLISV